MVRAETEGREVYWFGRPWALGICHPDYKIRVPVGEDCRHCPEVIGGNDSGFRLPGFRYYHRHCFAAATTAGLGTPD